MIANVVDKGKILLPKLIVPAIVVLVGVAAFGLGRLSALKEEQGGLVIYSAHEEGRTFYDEAH